MASANVTASPQLCPQLATPVAVITASNVDGLWLSNYSRVPGVRVLVSCLASPDYKVVGASMLTCLDSGQWDKPAPTCQQDVSTVPGGSGDTTMLPAMVIAGCFGVILLALVVIIAFVACRRKKKGLRCYGRRVHLAPAGLLHSVNATEGEVCERRHRLAASTSDCSDLIDSVSTRLSPYTHGRFSHFGTGCSPYPEPRGLPPPQRLPQHPPHLSHPAPRSPYSDSFNSVDPWASDPTRSPASTYHPARSAARSQGGEPPLMVSVGTRRSYRTWHDLFCSPDPSMR